MQQTYLAKHSSVDVSPHLSPPGSWVFTQGSMHFVSLFLHLLSHGSGGAPASHVAMFDRPSASSAVSPVMAVRVSVRVAD